MMLDDEPAPDFTLLDAPDTDGAVDDAPPEGCYTPVQLPPVPAIGSSWMNERDDDPFHVDWHLQVWDPAAAREHFHAIHGIDPDIVDEGMVGDRATRTLFRLAQDARRGQRSLLAPDSACTVALTALRAEMPNASGFISHVRDAAHAAWVTNTPLRLAPILLVGPPGTGKTRACQRLAEVLGTAHRRISMPMMSGAAPLTGTESTWKTSRPGLLASMIVEGSTASPLIVLDEIDKCFSSQHADQPLDVLHDLFEDTASQHFIDDALGVRMDASRVLWVASANDLAGLRSSLLDRMHVIEVLPPTADEMRAVVQGIYAELRATYWRDWHDLTLSAGPIDVVIGCHPRLARRVVADAMRLAALHRRRCVSADDMALAHRRLGAAPRPRFGFV